MLRFSSGQETTDGELGGTAEFPGPGPQPQARPWGAAGGSPGRSLGGGELPRSRPARGVPASELAAGVPAAVARGAGFPAERVQTVFAFVPLVSLVPSSQPQA